MAGPGTVSELHLKYIESAFDGARSVVRWMILINGASIVTLLGLIGALVGQGMRLDTIVDGLETPILLFAIGIASAVVAAMGFYLSDHNAAWGKPSVHEQFRRLALLLIVVSLVLFVVGSLTTLSVLHEL